MIERDVALRIVLEKTPRLQPVRVPLEEAVCRVLAEPVAGDIDLPPFDKSAMDGFAVRSEDLAELPVELEVIEDLPAGVAPQKVVKAGTCARIMTGAPVPEGADLVVMVEDTEPVGDRRVRILSAKPGRANICVRGEDVRQGEQVLAAGQVIRPPEIGLLASVGCGQVGVYRAPEVAVLATGDELVGIRDVPGPGQIRDANSWSLLTACRQAGVQADWLGVARDNEPDLREKIAAGLKQDILIVSGGVSMGEWDLVPKIFDEFAVTVHFRQIRQKPGKPTVFATSDTGVVFGLPGNPVSTIVGFRLYVLPCIRKMMGYPEPAPAPLRAVLRRNTTVRGSRLTYVPARLYEEGGERTVEVVDTKGSADLVGFCRANALVPLEPASYKAGTEVEALPFAV